MVQTDEIRKQRGTDDEVPLEELEALHEQMKQDRTHNGQINLIRIENEIMIRKYGYMIQGVTEEGLEPAYAYTIGLPKLKLPELIIVGLPWKEAYGLLEDIIKVLKHIPSAAKDGTAIEGILEGGLMMMLREASGGTDWMDGAVNFANDYGLPFRALQVIWPDKENVWPIAEKFSSSSPQPLFYLIKDPIDQTLP